MEGERVRVEGEDGGWGWGWRDGRVESGDGRWRDGKVEGVDGGMERWRVLMEGWKGGGC